jgi:paraquat-inducible protein B
MYPGQGGQSQRVFLGLEDPPLLEADTNGRSFTLISDDLGSLTRGATVSYRGIEVGEVSGFVLGPDSKSVRVTIFVHAPYDKLVHPQTHFWNAGGLDVTLGAQGARIRSNSWQQLLSGGVEFQTPTETLTAEPAAENSVFTLYENEWRARRDPRAEPLIYVSTFPDGARELEPGSAVELKGMEIGSVKSAELAYDEKRRTLETLVTYEIDPTRVDILGIPSSGTSDPHAKVANWIERLKRDGLHAQIASTNLITGRKIVTLDIVGGPNNAKTERRQGHELIPSSSSGDLSDTLASLRKVLDNLDRATSGPELGHAIKSLDSTLTRLDEITRDVQPDLKSLVKSLRETADAAQKTMSSVQGTLGNAGSNGTDVAELMRELKDAARSVRGLADYLDRHPEALIRGRKDEK